MKFIRSTFFLRSVAVFLALEMAMSAVVPTVSLALTAGPTAPEATSFEPVDTTDIVNLPTGDLVYNIPLLEIPGPAGGYPLALSYHAGIQPNEDASWVGLGWSLSPGAISRSVNGYPDDYNSITGNQRSFWEGGTTTTSNVGVSVGIAYVASVSADLSFSQDTYRGRGTGGQVGAGIGFGVGGNNSPASVNVGLNVGVTPYGESYVGANAGIGVGVGSDDGIRGTVGIGFSYNSLGGLNAGVSAGVSYSKHGVDGSMMGASISTGGSKFSASALGIRSSVHNSRAAQVSTDSRGWNAEIPVYYGINLRLGKSYQRYWTDAKADIKTNGTLYFPETQLTVTDLDTRAFDIYDLPQEDLIAELNYEKVLGGTFPDYDHYSVTGQGIGGSMRPQHFSKEILYRQNKKQGSTYLTQCEPLTETGVVGDNAQFRFDNDFSNRHISTPGDFFTNASGSLDYGSSTRISGENGNDGGTYPGHMIGSRSIEWYTNNQIVSGAARADGFIDAGTMGFDRASASPYMIGGFKITNESGVTYHYALPVYNRSEHTYSGWKDSNNIDYFNVSSTPTEYAYAWYLTAVTGPDFVDRGQLGTLDNADWGYWIQFNYGKWCSYYSWRNPSEGFHKDLDNKFNNFSMGRKELYYLNTIKSRSHVAIFEKEMRADGKGVTWDFGTAIPVSTTGSTVNGVDDGGFDIKMENGTYSRFPLSTLKLNNIYLLTHQDYEDAGGDAIAGNSGEPPDTRHLKQHIIDKLDIPQAVKDKAVRTINFGHDYSLCPNTPNSFDPNGEIYPPTLNVGLVNTKLGKLTLNTLKFLGKGGADVLPPTKFKYHNNHAYNKDAYDYWGYYKSDYTRTGIENLDRAPSSASAQNVNAWSLATVKSPLGSTIQFDYESDTHKVNTHEKSTPFIIETYSEGTTEATIYLKNIREDLYIRPGDRIEFKASYENIEIIPSQHASWRHSRGYHSIIAEGTVLSSHADRVVVTGIKLPYPPYQSPTQPGMYSDFFGGNVGIVSDAKDVFGGGLRVQGIKVTEAVSGKTYETNYKYTALAGDGSSGATSYKPAKLDQYDLYGKSVNHIGVYTLRKALSRDMTKVLSLAREMPAPCVFYEYVTVSQKIIDGNGNEFPGHGQVVYNFEVFDPSMIGIVDLAAATPTYRKMALKDYSSRVGNLKSVKTYDDHGVLLSETINHYLHDGINARAIPAEENDPAIDDGLEKNIKFYESSIRDRFNNQGVMHQTFANRRKARTAVDHPLLSVGIINKKEKFPSIQTGQTSINYKTGIRKTTENLKYDFYSGQAVKSLFTDGYGNTYISEILPAYRVPAYNEGMRPALWGGKNMLVQEAYSKTYKVAPVNATEPISNSNYTNVALVGASAQTWSNSIAAVRTWSWQAPIKIDQPDIWRKKASYSFTGDNSLALTDNNGLYAPASFTEFTAWTSSSSTPPGWQKNSEITLFDVFSHPLEGHDLNDIETAAMFDPLGEKVFATVANAGYDEFVYTGAEENLIEPYFLGRGIRTHGLLSTEKAHTGLKSVHVGPGALAFQFDAVLKSEKALEVSVWSDKSVANVKYKVNSGAYHDAVFEPVKQAGDWFLLKAILPVAAAGSTVTILCQAIVANTYFDDFRVHPTDSRMTSYVYNQWGELSHILDNNNLFTEYRYDAMGRLNETYKETFTHGAAKVSGVQYNYKNSNQ